MATSGLSGPENHYYQPLIFRPMDEKRKMTVQRASFRMLRRLGQVIRELKQLEPPGGGSSSQQLQRIESELVCNAIDIAEMFSGLPGWEDRLAFIRKAGIEVSEEVYEGFADAYVDDNE